MCKSPVMLIVDDVRINREILKGILKDEFTILEAENGIDAVRILHENSEISIVLLDIYMPIMDGFEVLLHMKEDKYLCNTPVIINTLKDEEDIESKALSLGASDFITKPYNADIIKRRTQNVLAKRNYENQIVVQEVKDKQLKELKYHVQRDLLTGIYNRETFYKKTAKMITKNKDTDYVVVCWDIDRFKVINDLFGTNVGDQILKHIARRFADELRNIGTYGRLAADNFAVCFPKEYLDVDRIVQIIDDGFDNFKLDYKITMCIGIYVIEDLSVNIDRMCDRANLALRTIKGNFIKRYAFYDEKLRNNLLEEQEIVSAMNDALNSKQFILYFQPIYSFSKEEMVSAEVLVRWNHPQKGIIYPGVFVPLFERNGFITKMDTYVWEEACKFIRCCLDEGKKVVPVSVNVSRMNFYNPNLTQIISALVQKYRIEPSMLKLEITESAYTENPMYLLETIKNLQTQGFEILMDDFGSGFSSLNMLKDIPVDILKIDMRFLDNIETSGRAENILTSVVRMAKWLNMIVVSEGVETKWQFDFLKSIGCDRAQGYFYSKPLPKQEFVELMQDEKTAIARIKDEISGNKFDISTVLNTNKEINILLEGMFSGMGVYILQGGVLEVLHANKDYFQSVDSPPEKVFSAGRDALLYIHMADRNKLLFACKKAANSKQVEKIIIRRKNKDGKYILLDLKLRFLGKKAESEIFYFAFNDITLRRKRIKTGKINEYTNTICRAYREILEINFTDNISTPVYLDGVFVFEKSIQKNLQRSLNIFADKKVHPSFRELFLSTYNREYFNRCFANSETKYFTLELKTLLDDGSYQWALMTVIKLDNPENKEIYLSCNKIVKKNNQICQDDNYMVEKLIEFEDNINDRSLEEPNEGTLKLIQDLGFTVFEYNVRKREMLYSYMGDNQKIINRSLGLYKNEDFYEKTFCKECIKYLNKAIKKACRDVVCGQIEYQSNLDDKGMRWKRTAYKSLINSNGNIYKIIGVSKDIQLERDREELIEKQKKYFEAAMSGALYAYDYNLISDKIVLIHQMQGNDFHSFERYLDVKNNENLYHPEDYQKVIDFFILQKNPEAYDKDISQRVLQYRIKNINNEWVWVEDTIFPVDIRKGEVSRGIGYVAIIEERKALEERAELDSLTGIYNRGALEERIELDVVKEQQCGTFFLYDIDNFKLVNDTYGHAEGDRLLRRVSEIIKSNFRASDIIGRIGGDEFVAFIRGNYKSMDYKQKAQGTIKDICGLSKEFGWKIPITVSLGISSSPTNGKTFDSLYRAADKALYCAKDQGKNRFCTFDEIF